MVCDCRVCFATIVGRVPESPSRCRIQGVVFPCCHCLRGRTEDAVAFLGVAVEEGVLKPLAPTSKFPMLGDIDAKKKETATVVKNKLYTAPLFQHTVPDTDFLLVLPRRAAKHPPYLRCELASCRTSSDVLWVCGYHCSVQAAIGVRFGWARAAVNAAVPAVGY